MTGCIQCGECCKNLYWYDRIIISLYYKTFQFSKVCKILNRDNKCMWFSARPNICNNWKCGAHFKEFNLEDE